MESEYAKHEKDYIKVYQEKGYTTNFRFDEGKLIASKTKESYSPEDIFIVADHRYEGMSNPSDMSILYVLETKDGKKGTHLLGYGPNADLDATEFFKAIPKENVSDRASIDS
ncbi:hypothetical protein K1F50_12450 [Muricauda oceani]|uniref:Phosphoribosylpyrophosphate synthetase n=1 Tax=Flagellimonas oceani TaxID=2698672 RepID=A0A6G7J057_9FLAO|nr:hypothetical protein [Allomuricauda oceani]MBW8243612.1 hypothetical protein [Allomuricauda oceani]QII44019.1 hypothetical protein GVT53_04805 [Allomuricauda oceani]